MQIRNLIQLILSSLRFYGANIESRRQGENAFSFLATDTTSPYTDTRPVKTPGQAEWRDYRGCWWDGHTASMAFGPVVRVLVNG